MEYLNRFPMDDLSEKEKRLMYMAFSFFDTAMAVELYKGPDVPNGYEWQRFQVRP